MAQSVASGIEVSLSLASLWFALVAQSRVNLPMTINVPCYLAIYPSIYLSILKSERIRCHSPSVFLVGSPTLSGTVLLLLPRVLSTGGLPDEHQHTLVRCRQ